MQLVVDLLCLWHFHTFFNTNEHTYLEKKVESARLYEDRGHCLSPHLLLLCHMEVQGIELGQGTELD